MSGASAPALGSRFAAPNPCACPARRLATPSALVAVFAHATTNTPAASGSGAGASCGASSLRFSTMAGPSRSGAFSHSGRLGFRGGGNCIDDTAAIPRRRGLSVSAASIGSGSVADVPYIERPTAEIRMSTASERAAATSAVGPHVATRMQADCIRALRWWCKLGYGDHVVVHVEHQQLASTSTPGLLTSAALTFTGPDGRRHAAFAIHVGVLCPPTPAASCPSAPPLFPSAVAFSSADTTLWTSAAAAAAAAGVESGTVEVEGSPSRPPAPPFVPGSAAPRLDPLPGLSLHWGCCHGPGQRWHGPPSGWHTLPAVSYDAGRGAWQTPLAVRQSIPGDEGLGGAGDSATTSTAAAATSAESTTSSPYGPWIASYSVLLQLPWEGPIRNGGVCFVLKTARNQWIKARLAGATSGGGGGEGDFWLGSSGLPLAANGTPLLPDVFHTTATSAVPDSLPQVFQWELNTQRSAAAATAATAPTPHPVHNDDSRNGSTHNLANGNGNNGDGHSPTAAGAPAAPSDTAPASTPTAKPQGTPIALPSPSGPPTPPPLTTSIQEEHRIRSQEDVASLQSTTESPPPPPRPPAPAATPSTVPVPTSLPPSDYADLLGAAAAFIAPPRLSDALLRPADRFPLLPAPAGPGGGGPGERPPGLLCSWMVDAIVQREPHAERSLMHRYNTGAELVEMAGGSSELVGALAAVTAWLRLSSARLLVWNRNYNVKPREISTAQARLAAALAGLGATRGPSAAVSAAAAPALTPPPSPSPSPHDTGSGSPSSPSSSPSSSSSGDGASASAGNASGTSNGTAAAVGLLVRAALAAVGRGGAGEVGQRIRDEILAVQHRNGCKGGMMEEWHQKLHNNTSPDDVVICRALLDYIAAGLDIRAYWSTLGAAGISAQRLASFDRPITSEPRFSGQQAAGLQRDLTAYLQTLQSVHGGDDLRSAVNAVLGYEGADMKGKRVVVPPVPGMATPSLARHLRSLLALQQHMASPAAAAAAAAAQQPQHQQQKKDRSAVEAGGGVHLGGPLRRPTDVASMYGLPGVVRLMEMVVEARHLIRPSLDGGEAACGGRLVDVVFLDLALDSTLRTALQGAMGGVRQAVEAGTMPYIIAQAAAAGAGGVAAGTGPAAAAGPIGDRSSSGGGGGVVDSRRAAAGSGGGGGNRPVPGAFAAAAAMSQALEVVRLAAENAALSTCPNDDLVASNKWLRLLGAQEDPRDARDRMLQALALSDRLARCLADQAAATLGLVQPAAEALGARLGLRRDSVAGVGEEVVRGSSGPPLAQLLAVLEPALRRATGGGVWQIVSRGSDRPVVAGRLRVEPRLAAVQHDVMSEPTVLLVEGITGAEEIPEGCVAVLVGSCSGNGGSGGGGCPDVLSHSAVRARNLGVLLAGCHSPELVARIRSHAGGRIMVRLEGSDVNVSFSSTGGAVAGAAAAANAAAAESAPPPAGEQ